VHHAHTVQSPVPEITVDNLTVMRLISVCGFKRLFQEPCNIILSSQFVNLFYVTIVISNVYVRYSVQFNYRHPFWSVA
jgi:hypothetical protein